MDTTTQTNEELINEAKAALDSAILTQASAKKNLEEIIASQRDVQKAYDDAKKALDAAKPALSIAKAQLTKAQADVTIARTNLAKLAPVATKSGAEHSKVRQVVTAMLEASPGGLTADEIYARLVADGIQMAGEKPRENLNAYLSRWDGIKNAGRGVWSIARGADAVDEVPAFLAPAEEPTEEPTEEVPAFLAPESEFQAEDPVDEAVEEPAEEPVKKSKKSKKAE